MNKRWLAIAFLLILPACQQPTATPEAEPDTTEQVSGEDLSTDERLALFAAIAQNSSQGSLMNAIDYADGKTGEVEIFFKQADWARINTDERVALAKEMQEAWAGIYSPDDPDKARIKIIEWKISGEFIPVGGSKPDGKGTDLFMTPQ